MTNWASTVVASNVSAPAKELAVLIGNRFVADNPGYALFKDLTAAGILGMETAEVGKARRELVQAGFLRPLVCGGRPSFKLSTCRW